MTEKEMQYLICSLERTIPFAENGMIEISVNAANELLELLKERRPVKAYHLHGTRVHSCIKDVTFTDECGFCSGYILRPWKTCPLCGKTIKWDQQEGDTEK